MAKVQWNSIKDFSPGIHNIITPNSPPGAAQENGTFRCVSGPNGELLPAPKLTTRYLHSPFSATPLESEQYRTTGLYVNNPVFYPPEASAGVDQNNSEIYMGFEYYTAGTYNMKVDRYKRNYANNPGWETLFSKSTVATYTGYENPKRCHFAAQRSNNPNPQLLGPVVVVFVFEGSAYMFPDDTNTAVNSLRYLPGDVDNDSPGGLVVPDTMVAHQGRVMILPLTVTFMGTNQVTANNEAFYFTRVNNLREIDTFNVDGVTPLFFASAVFTENPSGYQVLESLSASELFMIKAGGGAVVLRGALEAFSAINYPYVKGTGYSQNRGSKSPIGFVYPVDAGEVWSWEGGEISKNIAKQMAPDFWRPPPVGPSEGEQSDTLFGNWPTSSAQFQQWVMLPDNWMYDTDFNGWWRIENPDETIYGDNGGRAHINYWASDWRGKHLYGAPSGWNEGDHALFEFSNTIAAHSFFWRSHPLSQTVDRSTVLEAVIPVATGKGSLRVTVRSADDPIGQTATMEVSDERQPSLQKLVFGVIGTHHTIQVESYADDQDFEAPTVHEIRFAINDNTDLAGI